MIKHRARDVVEDLPKSFVDLIQCSEADGRLYDLISTKSLCPLGSFKVISESQLSFIFRFVTTSVFLPLTGETALLIISVLSCPGLPHMVT